MRNWVLLNEDLFCQGEGTSLILPYLINDVNQIEYDPEKSRWWTNDYVKEIEIEKDFSKRYKKALENKHNLEQIATVLFNYHYVTY